MEIKLRKEAIERAKKISLEGEPPFYNKDGTLTAYGLQCGYVDRVEKDQRFVEIYHEHGHYHVRSGKVRDFCSDWSVINDYPEAQHLFNSLLERL